MKGKKLADRLGQVYLFHVAECDTPVPKKQYANLMRALRAAYELGKRDALVQPRSRRH